MHPNAGFRWTAEAAMRAFVGLSATFEPMLASKPVWTRAKMTPGRSQAMLPAIQCSEIVPTAWRGTRKTSQNKTPAERAALADVLAAIGRDDEATLVRPA